MSKSKGLESLLMDGVSGSSFSLSPSIGKHYEAFSCQSLLRNNECIGCDHVVILEGEWGSYLAHNRPVFSF